MEYFSQIGYYILTDMVSVVKEVKMVVCNKMTQEFVYNSSKEQKQLGDTLKSEVFEAAKNGDSEAFGTIYKLYFNAIFRFIYYRTSHQETAEDLTEQVFSKAWVSLPRLQGDRTKLQGWLYQIARNAVIDNFRKNKEVIGLEAIESLPSYEATALETLEVLGDKKVLLEAISELSVEQQAVIKLRFLEDFDIEEIANLLGKSAGNVRIIQYRALKVLRSILGNKSK